MILDGTPDGPGEKLETGKVLNCSKTFVSGQRSKVTSARPGICLKPRSHTHGPDSRFLKVYHGLFFGETVSELVRLFPIQPSHGLTAVCLRQTAVLLRFDAGFIRLAKGLVKISHGFATVS